MVPDEAGAGARRVRIGAQELRLKNLIRSLNDALYARTKGMMGRPAGTVIIPV